MDPQPTVQHEPRDESESYERVVKLSLSKLCKGDSILVDAFHRLSIQSSQMIVRGCIVMHFMVSQCVNNNQTVPSDFLNQKFVEHAFNWDYQDNPHKIQFPAVRAAVDGIDPARHLFHCPNIYEGRGWILGYAVKQFVANTKTSIKKKWKGFVQDDIKSYLRIHQENSSRYMKQSISKEIKRRVFNPTRQAAPNAPNLDQAAIELVDFHRDGFMLNPGQSLRKELFNNEANYHHYVTHFGKCLERQRQLEVAHNIQLKKRLPLPMNGINLGCVQIDKKGCCFVLKAYRDLGGNVNRANMPAIGRVNNFTKEMYYKWMHELLDIDDALSGAKAFPNDGVGLTVNGVKACLHYVSTADDEEEEDDDTNLNNIFNLGLSISDDEDDDGDDDDDDGEGEVDLLQQAIAQAGKFSCYILCQFFNALLAYTLPSVLGAYNDPGRTNVFFVHLRELATGNFVAERVFTRGAFNETAGINTCVRRANKWLQEPQLKDALTSLSENHFKTTNLNELEDSVFNYYNIFDFIWQKMAVSKKWERQNLFLYGSKRRTVHSFLNSLTIDGYGPPVMFYGSGEFPAGQKGERYVPCKWVKKESKRFYHCFIVNEFRTSQVCPVCDERLYKVMKHHRNGKRKEVRGLKWCASEWCKDCRLKSRDDVGCLNIYRKTLAEYPAVLDRHRGVVWVDGPGVYEFRPPY